jgi:hypothetical protein
MKSVSEKIIFEKNLNMEFTPLADPFKIRFGKDGIQYEAKVIYAKSISSCTNVFNVEMNWPQGIEPFCLKEKPVHNKEQDLMVWVDEEGRESVFYQLLGEQIADYLKNQLGVFLLDTPVAGKTEETENF